MCSDVEVVFYAVNAIEVAFFVFQDSPNVFEQFGAVFLGKCALSFFGAENDLIEDLGVGAHVVTFYLQRSVMFGTSMPASLDFTFSKTTKRLNVESRTQGARIQPLRG